MALILNIDTSTSVCSVALARDGKMIALKENNEGLNHSVLLGTYIDEILKDNHMDAHCLDAVAISMGPGSYTGLRIGVSMAKGVCFGAGKPLIDARRMEVYTAFFDRNNQKVIDTKAEIVDENSFADLLAGHKIYFFGNGSDKVRMLLTAPNAHFMGQVETSARHMIPLAEELFGRQEFVDVAYFEPFYLKDFIATTPKKKVI